MIELLKNPLKEGLEKRHLKKKKGVSEMVKKYKTTKEIKQYIKELKIKWRWLKKMSEKRTIIKSNI